MLAGCLLRRLVDVLPEIELLRWVDLTARRYLEVCIRYLAVPVAIKTVEHLLKLLIRQKESFSMQVRLQLAGFNGSRLFLIEVREGFLECLPLELDFLKHGLFDIHGLDRFVEDALIKAFEPLINNLDVFVILGVLHGIMAEVKTLRFLNLSSHPLAEVGVVDAALSFLVLVNDELGEIFEVQFFVLAPEVPQNIFDRHEAIVVAVEIQEGFADTRPVVCELDLDQLFEVQQLLLYS